MKHKLKSRWSVEELLNSFTVKQIDVYTYILISWKNYVDNKYL